MQSDGFFRIVEHEIRKYHAILSKLDDARKDPTPGNKDLEALQRHWIETKNRLQKGEVVSESFEEHIKTRFKGFDPKNEDWFN